MTWRLAVSLLAFLHLLLLQVAFNSSFRLSFLLSFLWNSIGVL